MKIIRRTSPAFRVIAHPAPSRAGVSTRWPSKRAIGAAYHWLLGTDNAGDLCQITGKRLHPNLRGYIADGGSAYTVAPTVTFPNGAVGNVVLSGSTVPTTTKISGGSGYTSTPDVGVTGTFAPGGWLPRYKAITAAGAIADLAILDPGFGLLTDPVLTVTGGGGTGASFTAALQRSVKVINVTAGGTGYTAPPAVAVNGGSPSLNARAIAVVSAGAVTQILLLDGGSRYLSTPTVAITGGGGTGATATAVIGVNTVRAIEITDCGSQTGTIAATLTGGDGTGASGGALMAAGTYVRSASFLTIPAGGNTDTNAQNGLLMPMLDDGQFTVIAVVKKTTTGTSQVVMGTATEGGSAFGGFDVKNIIGTGYRVVSFNVQTSAATLASPGVDGNWVAVVYSVTPVAGESIKPSASFLQSNRLYARIGSQTALSVATGERVAPSKRRLIGIGNTQQIGVGFRAAIDVAEVIGYQRALSTAEIDAEIAAITARQAARGNTLVN